MLRPRLTSDTWLLSEMHATHGQSKPSWVANTWASKKEGMWGDTEKGEWVGTYFTVYVYEILKHHFWFFVVVLFF